MLPSSPFYSGYDGTQSKVLVCLSNSEAKLRFSLKFKLKKCSGVVGTVIGSAGNDRINCFIVIR